MASVLIVDDEPELCQLLRLFIERDGRYAVCGDAGDGRQALELVESRNPDLLVLDLHMPGMDGLEVLAALQGRPRPRIVVLSANSELRGEALGLGADQFVMKAAQGFDQVLDTLDAVATEHLEDGR